MAKRKQVAFNLAETRRKGLGRVKITLRAWVGAHPTSKTGRKTPPSAAWRC